MTLSPLHLVVNWPVFTIYIAMYVGLLHKKMMLTSNKVIQNMLLSRMSCMTSPRERTKN